MTGVLTRTIGGAALALLLVAGMTAAVRVSYGALESHVHVTLEAPRAGQGLLPGSEVLIDGVVVGDVRGVQLGDGHVEIDLRLRAGTRVPADARARVQPKTLFGEKEVAISLPNGDQPPYLDDGDRLVANDVGREVEELLDVVTGLLQEVEVGDVVVLVDELTATLRGRATSIQSSIRAATELFALLAETMPEQQATLEQLDAVGDHLVALGDDLNRIAREANQALPAVLAASEDLSRLLHRFPEVAEHLSILLEDIRPDVHRLLESGVNVSRVLTVRREQLRETIQGVGLYMEGAATHGISPEVLPDGTRFGYFSLFTFRSELEEIICGTFVAAGPEMRPVVDALGSTGVFDCRYPEDQAGPPSPRPGFETSPDSHRPPSLADQLLRGLGQVDATQRRNVDTLLAPFLGEQP